MRVLIDFNHPAHVHLFKNFIWEMQKKGHEFKLIARDKECVYELLDAYGFKYVKRKGYKGLMKFFGMFLIDWQIYKIANEFKPDVLIGEGNPYIAQVGWLLKKPSYIFDDSEHANLQMFFIKPFATKILTPKSYLKNLGAKQIRYNGYKELAYLHPKYFKPDASILKELGLKRKEYIILRFVSWEANHDIGDFGIKDKLGLVKKLEKYGKVVISSEKKVPNELEKYVLKIPAEKMHHVIAFAKLLIGESATMASEAAVLGVPAIFISQTRRGYTDDEERYGLVYNLKNENEIWKIMEKIDKIDFGKLRKRMLDENVDVTKFFIDYFDKK